MKSVLEEEVIKKYGQIEAIVIKNDVLHLIDKTLERAKERDLTMDEAFSILRRKVYCMEDYE